MNSTLTTDMIFELAEKLEATHPGKWDNDDLEALIRATEEINS